LIGPSVFSHIYLFRGIESLSRITKKHINCTLTQGYNLGQNTPITTWRKDWRYQRNNQKP